MAVSTIEHIWTVLTIDEIVNVPGLDLLFIGPGRPRHQHGPRRTCRSSEVQQMTARGYNALVVGFDRRLLRKSVNSVLGNTGHWLCSLEIRNRPRASIQIADTV
jgi:2-keto-3-deoxy-L-rhamnonate aldolase RhmA